MTCHKPTLEELHRKGYRLTAQRALILEDLFHHPGHRTAEDIFQNVSIHLPGLNRATIYRTLELLQEAEVVTVFNGDDGLIKYELVRNSTDHHHHLHCRQCGAYFPLGAAPVAALAQQIQEMYGFQAELNHVVISGLCSRCAEKIQEKHPS
jgi:Fur family transcriptional regulator, ferric uptake regulator